MIETVILNHLMTELNTQDVYMEVPETNLPDRFVVVEKTGGNMENHLWESSVAVQSYGPSMLAAAMLNESVKAAMDSLAEEPEVTKAAYDSDYNFTDTDTKRYRYQCVYDVTHY